ncbi:MAG: DUF362 domain-containing protein [Thermodesulfobacteriota bacterium]
MPGDKGKKSGRVLVREADYDESIRAAIEEAFQAFPLDLAGKKVLVKPNILAPHRPDAAVTTHPTLVRETVAFLVQKGAQVMVGDNPGVGGYGRSESSARTCGLFDAAEGCFVNLARRPVQHPVPSRFFSRVTVSREVLEADLVVSLPKLKTHGLTVLTGGVKNTFGYVVGGEKMRVHAAATTPARFAEALVDIYSIRPPDLTIMDAVVAMEGNGPSNGKPRRLGKILASDNAVCLDAVACALTGIKPGNVPTLAIAHKRGLGEIAHERIPVDGAFTPASGFATPSTFVPGIAGMLLNRFLSRRIACMPEVDRESCKACGLCAEHCPVSAMEFAPGAPPKPDEKKCIRCYCCQEMCPSDAIRLSGRVIGLARRAIASKQQS